MAAKKWLRDELSNLELKRKNLQDKASEAIKWGGMRLHALLSYLETKQLASSEYREKYKQWTEMDGSSTSLEMMFQATQVEDTQSQDVFDHFGLNGSDADDKKNAMDGPKNPIVTENEVDQAAAIDGSREQQDPNTTAGTHKSDDNTIDGMDADLRDLFDVGNEEDRAAVDGSQEQQDPDTVAGTQKTDGSPEQQDPDTAAGTDGKIDAVDGTKTLATENEKDVEDKVDRAAAIDGSRDQQDPDTAAGTQRTDGSREQQDPDTVAGTDGKNDAVNDPKNPAENEVTDGKNDAVNDPKNPAENEVDQAAIGGSSEQQDPGAVADGLDDLDDAELTSQLEVTCAHVHIYIYNYNRYLDDLL